MRLSYRDVLTANPTLRDFANWPSISVSTIPASKAEQFHRNRAIVCAVLKGEKLKVAAAKYRVTPASVTQLMQRCLESDNNDEQMLTWGLIPYYRKPGSRNEARPNNWSGEPKLGHAGDFRALLRDVPNLETSLDRKLNYLLKRQRGHGGKRVDEIVTRSSFHQYLLSCLSQAQWPQDRYPYTVPNLGKSASDRYFDSRLNELKRFGVQGKRDSLAMTSRMLKSGFEGEEIQIDEHLIDLMTSTQIKYGNLNLDLRLSRVTLVVATITSANCVCNFALFPTASINQDELLSFILSLLRPYELPKSSLDLSLPDKPFFPGQLLNNKGDLCAFSNTICWDNALVHHAKSVRFSLASELGLVLETGRPQVPQIRDIVEHAFKGIGELVRRLPNTTGNSPVDPIRESKILQKETPVFSLQSMREILTANFAKHNCASRAELSGLSPIGYYQELQISYPCSFLPRYKVREFERSCHETRCHIKKYGGSPRIYWRGGRYTGPGIKSAYLSGQTYVTVLPHSINDVRKITVYGADNTNWGEATVGGGWRKYPHTISLRLMLTRFCKLKKLRLEDPVTEAIKYLTNGTLKAKQSTQLIRILEVVQSTSSSNIELGSEIQSGPPSLPTKGDSMNYTWSLSVASRVT